MRYFLLEVSNKYKMDKPFLVKLNNGIRNASFANHFYTYLMSNEFITTYQDFYQLSIPNTTYKDDLINISEHHIHEYINFLLYEEFDKKIEDDKDSALYKEKYISYISSRIFNYKSSELYEHYKNWFSINNINMNKCLSNTIFKQYMIDNGFQYKRMNNGIIVKYML